MNPPNGWYPAPNGDPKPWYWDGTEWVGPVMNLEEHIVEHMIPHLERMWVEGYKAGQVKMFGTL
ncbi:hypothetical protein KIV66_gp84 [Mycobacterium phage MyraDee]|uniref:DUF2510 domain-containing protein n=1 Tax=Mycobacterium phage MyraDee TaxID=2024303 RepID=A0A222YY31_9CAUD|nr:hypothetical protein KIV66_gp84 [Mycobacterium phage MyraDee]ASR77191.1 hypothetical protein SEA_MYRADEE_84 [Mycobacterium phage MyraDee]